MKRFFLSTIFSFLIKSSIAFNSSSTPDYRGSFLHWYNDSNAICSIQIKTYSQLHKKADIESLPVLFIKYAIALDTTVESIGNHALYSLIDEWMGVKYQYGGNSKEGIDCSSFSGMLFQKLYGINLPRTSTDQYQIAEPVEDPELLEGDLLFFKTGKSPISHVGVYLGNGRFVHASTIKGVTIDHLEFPYYKKTYLFAGRVYASSGKE
jgi:lipoprotein Spr